MRFIITEPDQRTFKPSRFPTAVLRRDHWNDYGFRTTYLLSMHLSEERIVEIGDVKILKRGQESGSTPLPDDTFSKLGEEYCSLGQAFSYYEALLKLGRAIFRPVLRGLRDVSIEPQRLAAFEDEHGFKTSLLRSSSAAAALKDAPLLLGVKQKAGGAGPISSIPGDLKFSFKTQVGGSNFLIDFDFGGDSRIPGRINAVIGYNGTGKTRLLANLAMVTYRSGDPDQIQRDQLYGRFIENEVRFGAVIAVSYSAFDTFELPGKTVDERERVEERGDVFGYAYCGLRKYLPDQNPLTEGPQGLKTINEIGNEFSVAVRRATGKGRRELFIRAMTPLAHEPSFNRIGIGDFLARDPTGLSSLFESMSTGHKIVVNIVAQLVAQTEMRSLVLLDEPESHLHPPLLAALLKSIRIVLEDRDSFAIVATHSPVVLQETPGQHVRILRRFETKTVVAVPEIETFGESIGLLTQHIFGLDTSATDFHSVLERLARDYSIDQIESLFSKGLSSQARAFIFSVKRSNG